MGIFDAAVDVLKSGAGAFGAQAARSLFQRGGSSGGGPGGGGALVFRPQPSPFPVPQVLSSMFDDPTNVGTGVFEETGAILGLTPVSCGDGSFFRAPTARATCNPKKDIQKINPATGKVEHWQHRGRAVVFSRDLTNAKSTMRRLGMKCSRGPARRSK